jgi:hypothetical protein
LEQEETEATEKKLGEKPPFSQFAPVQARLPKRKQGQLLGQPVAWAKDWKRGIAAKKHKRRISKRIFVLLAPDTAIFSVFDPADSSVNPASARPGKSSLTTDDTDEHGLGTACKKDNKDVKLTICWTDPSDIDPSDMRESEIVLARSLTARST